MRRENQAVDTMILVILHLKPPLDSRAALDCRVLRVTLSEALLVPRDLQEPQGSGTMGVQDNQACLAHPDLHRCPELPGRVSAFQAHLDPKAHQALPDTPQGLPF